jgi:hypothetical protein
MRGIVVDANLLLLLVVGSCDPSLISKHKRLSAFAVSDFERLITVLAGSNTIVTVPHVLAEVGNMLSDGNDPDAQAIKSHFARLIKETLEVYKPSARVVDEPEFRWLGLSDAAQLAAAEGKHLLLTADGPLFNAACTRGIEAYYFQVG